MTEAINAWVIRLTGAAIIASAAITAAPDGVAKRVVKLVCGLISVMVLLSIGTEIDHDAYLDSFEVYRNVADRVVSEAEEEAEAQRRKIIEEETAAYILDKAACLDMADITVTVSAERGDDGYWYPESAELTGTAGENDMRELGRYIETELGITEEKQRWNTDE